jgi:Zn-finger nucleic acid-binding protein
MIGVLLVIACMRGPLAACTVGASLLDVAAEGLAVEECPRNIGVWLSISIL